MICSTFISRDRARKLVVENATKTEEEHLSNICVFALQEVTSISAKYIDRTSLAMMNFAFDHGGIGPGFDFETGDSIVVNVVAFKVAHAVVESENADVPAVMNVIPAHYRIRVVLHPHSSQRVATNFIVFVSALKGGGGEDQMTLRHERKEQ